MSARRSVRLQSWNIETGRRIDMEKFDFVLSFSVMADHELDARVKLKDLLKAISKEDIFWAMTIVKRERDDA